MVISHRLRRGAARGGIISKFMAEEKFENNFTKKDEQEAIAKTTRQIREYGETIKVMRQRLEDAKKELEKREKLAADAPNELFKLPHLNLIEILKEAIPALERDIRMAEEGKKELADELLKVSAEEKEQ